MSESKWTAGPWHYDGSPYKHNIWATEPHKVVCTLASDEPDVATAFLISAAPELYGALVEARSALDPYYATDECKKIDAALAKARGEKVT